MNRTDVEDRPELNWLRKGCGTLFPFYFMLSCHTEGALLTLPLHSLSGWGSWMRISAYFKHPRQIGANGVSATSHSGCTPPGCVCLCVSGATYPSGHNAHRTNGRLITLCPLLTCLFHPYLLIRKQFSAFTCPILTCLVHFSQNCHLSVFKCSVSV